MRKLPLLLAMALFLAGCGGAGAATMTSVAGATPDGPPAPDFELVLGDGSTFSLSAAEKPVYMVFWAEW